MSILWAETNAALREANQKAKCAEENLAEAEKIRDEHAKTVQVLANELDWYAFCADDWHTCHGDKFPCEACENIKRLNAATRETQKSQDAVEALKAAASLRKKLIP
jgi:hypothetical protein